MTISESNDQLYDFTEESLSQDKTTSLANKDSPNKRSPKQDKEYRWKELLGLFLPLFGETLKLVITDVLAWGVTEPEIFHQSVITVPFYHVVQECNNILKERDANLGPLKNEEISKLLTVFNTSLKKRKSSFVFRQRLGLHLVVLSFRSKSKDKISDVI